MIGIIVDGDGDYASLRSRFPSDIHVLKTDGPRGHTVKACDIIGSACKQIDMLFHLGCQAVAVITDYENRIGGYSEFIKEMEDEVDSMGFSVPVFVSIPNRMIENWYLADIEILSKKKVYIRDHLRQKIYEGKDGKKVLRGLFNPKYHYNEIKHGAELFKLIRASVAEKNSSSFNRFMKLMKQYA